MATETGECMSDPRTAEKAVRAPWLPAKDVSAQLITFDPPQKHVASVQIRVIDSKGDSYYFEASCDDFELQPTCPVHGIILPFPGDTCGLCKEEEGK